MKKNNLTYNDYQKYLNDTMSAKERHEFEKRMMQDAFDEEAFDGLNQLSGVQSQKDINEVKSRMKELTKKKKQVFPFWLRYAAAAAIVIGFGLISILYFNSSPKYDLDYNSTAGKAFAIADTTGKTNSKKTKKTLPTPAPTLKNEKKKQIEQKKDIEPTAQPKEIIVEDFEEQEEMLAFSDEEQEPEIEATHEGQSGSKSTNSVNTMSETEVSAAAKTVQSTKKSMSKERIVSDKTAQPAMARRTDTHRAMPPIGLDYSPFRKQLTEEIAKILVKHNEETIELTITIMIDDTGMVTEVRTEETLKPKTMKEINSYIKELGKWEPEIEDGIAKKSKQIINLNF